jgi:hypothetical protein
MEKMKIEQHGSAGLLWVGAWLFVIGFLQLSFWKGVLALLLWPYYLGVALRTLAPH